MADPFPLVEISGAPFDRGVAYGRTASERIKRSIALYTGQLSSLAMSDAQITRLVERFLPKVAAFDQSQIDEMRGIAQGAGVSLTGIAMVNMRMELLMLAKDARKVPLSDEDDGCTGAIAFGAATADGEVLHAQNWDWRHECAETTVVLKIVRNDGPDVLTFTEAGGVARNGLNEAGIALTANFLGSSRDNGEIGIPLPFIRRKALEQTDLSSALQILDKTPKTGSTNVMISHADGFAVNLECAPNETFALYPEQDMIAHANRWKSPVALSKLQDNGTSPSSYYRDWRVERLLRQNHGEVTDEHMKAAFADRFGWPQSVCRPPMPDASSNLSATVATVLMRPARKTMEIAPLPAEGAHFTSYSI